MKSFVKFLIIAFAALIILFIIAFVFIRFTFNEKQIRSMAERTVSQAIDRPVELGRIRLRLGWGVKVDITDLRVANAPGFSDEPMLTINTTQLALQLLPLFRKRIVVDEIMLRELRLLVERNGNGQMNLPARLTNPPAPEDEKSKGWQLGVSRIDLKDGIIDYRDSAGGFRILVSNIAQQARFAGESVAVVGLSDVEAFLPVNGGSSVFLKIVNNVAVKPAAKQVTVTALDITWPPNTVSISGTINNFDDLDLSGKAALVEFDKIISFVDRNLARDLKLKGSVNVDFKVSGPTRQPRVGGHAELSELAATYHPVKGSLDKIYGSLDFTPDRIHDIKLSGKMGNVNLKVGGSIDSLKNPRLVLDINVDGNLVDLKGSVPEIEKMGLVGIMSATMGLRGPVNRLRYSGSASVTNGQITALTGVKPVTDLALNCDFKNDTVAIRQLSCKIVQSDLALQGKIVNFKKPHIDLAGTSRRFNLDEVLIPQKSAGGSRSQPPELVVKTRLVIDDLQFYNIQSRRAKATADYDGGRLRVRSTSFDAYDGQVTGDADFDFNQDPVAHRINVTVTNTEAKMVLKQFTGFDALSGKMNGRGQFSGTGFAPKDMKTTFNAEGHAALRNGTFVNFNFLTKLLAWLTLGEGKTVSFSDLGTEFKIQNGRVRFDDFICATKIGDFLVFGTLGFDGDIDYKINLMLDQEQSAKFKAVHGDWLFYTDERGRIVIDILAIGTLAAPQFKLDSDKIKKRLEKKIEGETKKKVEDVKKKLKDWWKNR